MAIDEADGGDTDDAIEAADAADVETAVSSEAADTYDWEAFKAEYYYDENGNPPTDRSGQRVEFDPEEYLGFDSDQTDGHLALAGEIGDRVADVVEDRSVDVSDDLDEDAFFSESDGSSTVVTRYDLEKAVPDAKKTHFREVDRYWVNKPYAFVIIFHSEKENEKKYYLIEPHLTPIEADLREFLSTKLKAAIKYSSDDVVVEGTEEAREDVIERETQNLLERYDLYAEGARPDANADAGDVVSKMKGMIGMGGDGADEEGALVPSRDVTVRPEHAVIEEDPETLDGYQIDKLLYLLKRDFIGFERIDGIKHDINVEDISCDGYNSPVFVYHSDYEQLITNVYHGEEELDDFVVKLAQRSGKGISKRQPQVDATLPDGSRAQLTLGKEVSDHGTNYTIRQFKDVPFTPVDLINWNTFSLDEMAFLWLCIENNKSVLFAGGTASGKTTSLNAVSLFIPSKAKIVSIEDTREVELPQRNWIASVTRPS
ncbi:MAG: ATPase, T2SS/T4P/T4SS family, partial [Haloglomus sp.]